MYGTSALSNQTRRKGSIDILLILVYKHISEKLADNLESGIMRSYVSSLWLAPNRRSSIVGS